MGSETDNSDDDEVPAGRQAKPASLLAKRLERAQQRIAELELALAVTGMYDSRTGARSRNALLDAIEYQMRWCARHETTFGVIVAHIPPTADGAHAAAVAAATLRGTDLVATWEELTIGILLPGLGPDTAAAPWSRVVTLLPVTDAVAAFPETDMAADDLLLAAEESSFPAAGVTRMPLSTG